jgi:hypothetical protein
MTVNTKITVNHFSSQVVAIPPNLRDELDVRKIMNLDSACFTKEQKLAMIEALYGKKDEWTWKQDLVDVQADYKRWQGLLSQGAYGKNPFRFNHAMLVRMGQLFPPEETGRTVTAFTDWIFRLYKPQRDYVALKRGAHFEREIAIKRVRHPQHTGWKLIYDGMNGSEEHALPISELAINGDPIYGKPDLVFREKKTGRIMILEIKVSERDIPSDGWPNLQAQLWAYSKIDIWKDAPEVLLVSEVWSYSYGVRRRGTIQYLRDDPIFQSQNRKLFNLYCTKGLRENIALAA